MDRVASHDFVPAISEAHRLIPKRLHRLVASDFLCGCDPIFAGLHPHTDANYDRSYRDTAHCAYPFHQAGLPKTRRRTTVVLPSPVDPEVVVHELGHVLHESLRFEPDCSPVSWYAETDEFESFAESFTAWLVPGYAERPDLETITLFESLAVE
jgi:hypothetical protein